MLAATRRAPGAAPWTAQRVPSLWDPPNSLSFSAIMDSEAFEIHDLSHESARRLDRWPDRVTLFLMLNSYNFQLLYSKLQAPRAALFFISATCWRLRAERQALRPGPPKGCPPFGIPRTHQSFKLSWLTKISEFLIYYLHEIFN